MLREPLRCPDTRVVASAPLYLRLFCDELNRTNRLDDIEAIRYRALTRRKGHRSSRRGRKAEEEGAKENLSWRSSEVREAVMRAGRGRTHRPSRGDSAAPDLQSDHQVRNPINRPERNIILSFGDVGTIWALLRPVGIILVVFRSVGSNWVLQVLWVSSGHTILLWVIYLLFYGYHLGSSPPCFEYHL